MQEELVWKEISQKEVYEDKIFKVKHSMRESTDKQYEFSILETKSWVNVISKIKGAKDYFLMVRQYRHGIDQVTLEFPGGAIEDGEDALESAKREMIEETGYRIQNIKKIGEFAPIPSFLKNNLHVFYSENVEKTQAQQLDMQEIIELVFIEEDKLLKEKEFVKSGINLAIYGLYMSFLQGKL